MAIKLPTANQKAFSETPSRKRAKGLDAPKVIIPSSDPGVNAPVSAFGAQVGQAEQAAARQSEQATYLETGVADKAVQTVTGEVNNYLAKMQEQRAKLELSEMQAAADREFNEFRRNQAKNRNYGDVRENTYKGLEEIRKNILDGAQSSWAKDNFNAWSMRQASGYENNILVNNDKLELMENKAKAKDVAFEIGEGIASAESEDERAEKIARLGQHIDQFKDLYFDPGEAEDMKDKILRGADITRFQNTLNEDTREATQLALDMIENDGYEFMTESDRAKYKGQAKNQLERIENKERLEYERNVKKAASSAGDFFKEVSLGTDFSDDVWEYQEKLADSHGFGDEFRKQKNVYMENREFLMADLQTRKDMIAETAAWVGSSDTDTAVESAQRARTLIKLNQDIMKEAAKDPRAAALKHGLIDDITFDVRALTDPDPEVRGQAVQALEEMSLQTETQKQYFGSSALLTKTQQEQLVALIDHKDTTVEDKVNIAQALSKDKSRTILNDLTEKKHGVFALAVDSIGEDGDKTLANLILTGERDVKSGNTRKFSQQDDWSFYNYFKERVGDTMMPDQEANTRNAIQYAYYAKYDNAFNDSNLKDLMDQFVGEIDTIGAHKTIMPPGVSSGEFEDWRSSINGNFVRQFGSVRVGPMENADPNNVAAMIRHPKTMLRNVGGGWYSIHTPKGIMYKAGAEGDIRDNLYLIKYSFLENAPISEEYEFDMFEQGKMQRSLMQ